MDAIVIRSRRCREWEWQQGDGERLHIGEQQNCTFLVGSLSNEHGETFLCDGDDIIQAVTT